MLHLSYQNYDAQISCPDVPDKWLIDSINNAIKENINNVPRIKKETALIMMTGYEN